MFYAYLLTFCTAIIVNSAPHKLPHLDDQGKIDVATFQKYVSNRRAEQNRRQKLMYHLLHGKNRPSDLPTPPPVTIVTELLAPLCNKDNGYKTYYYTLHKVPKSSSRYRYNLIAAYLAVYRAPVNLGPLTIRVMDLSRSSAHDVIFETRGSPSRGEMLQIDITSLFRSAGSSSSSGSASGRMRRRRWLELDIELTDSRGRRVDDVLSMPRPCYETEPYDTLHEPTIDMTFTRKSM